MPFDDRQTLPPTVFLHIPKTAGQTIHNAMSAMFGAARTSPVRVHSQAGDGAAQLPPGYAFYSGHIDWTALESLPSPRFVFTVLRDPRERIASFYLYLEAEARKLDHAALQRPENLGKRRILDCSADDYFLGGDPAWQRFIRDHYDNFYTGYFATRRFRGHGGLDELDDATLWRRVAANMRLVDRVYDTAGLHQLETDIAQAYGQRIRVTDRFDNTGTAPRHRPRWPDLIARFESDAAARSLESFVARDLELMDRLGLRRVRSG